jgi:hypothetical protein
MKLIVKCKSYKIMFSLFLYATSQKVAGARSNGVIECYQFT